MSGPRIANTTEYPGSQKRIDLGCGLAFKFQVERFTLDWFQEFGPGLSEQPKFF
jgi:hypothetical protein